MKKFFSLLACILIIAMVFSFGACGGEETPPATEETKITTYLDKDATTTYAEIEELIEGYTNYTFNNVVSSDISMRYGGSSMALGNIAQTLKYSYAGENYYALEKMSVNEDPQEMLSMIIPNGANVQITCVDDLVYISCEGYQELMNIPDYFYYDDGTFGDLQTATNISLDVKDMPLYGPSANALADGYFKLNDSGAILTVVISGDEAAAWHEQNLASQFNADLDYGNITYKIYLDEEGLMQKIEYSYNYSADVANLPGYVFDYDVVGTITITEVGTTMISAPTDASKYTKQDFIR